MRAFAGIGECEQCPHGNHDNVGCCSYFGCHCPGAYVSPYRANAYVVPVIQNEYWTLKRRTNVSLAAFLLMLASEFFVGYLADHHIITQWCVVIYCVTIFLMMNVIGKWYTRT